MISTDSERAPNLKPSPRLRVRVAPSRSLKFRAASQRQPRCRRLGAVFLLQLFVVIALTALNITMTAAQDTASPQAALSPAPSPSSDTFGPESSLVPPAESPPPPSPPPPSPPPPSPPAEPQTSGGTFGPKLRSFSVALTATVPPYVQPSFPPGGCTIAKCNALGDGSTLTSTSPQVGNWLGKWNPTIQS